MRPSKTSFHLIFILFISTCTCSEDDSDKVVHHKGEIRRRLITKRTNYDIFGESSGGGYLLAESTDQKLDLLNPLDANLSRILDIQGPDMRPSRGFLEPDMISLDISKRAWTLFREHAIKATRIQVESARSQIEQLIIRANVSEGCRDSIEQVLSGAKRMESWAIKLINSWGSFPPVGIFEGTYSEVGSFDTCVTVTKNTYIDHAHYCSITFRPVMPYRKDYEIVVRKESPELLNLFSKQHNASDHVVRDAFQDLMEHSQYHHYVYYKLGTCWPYKCSPFDVRRIARVIGRMNILSGGPVKCYSLNISDYEELDLSNSSKKLEISVWDKNDGIFIWKPFFNDAQKMASVVLVSITVFLLFMSLIDFLMNYLPALFAKLLFTLKSSDGQREEEFKEIEQHTTCQLSESSTTDEKLQHQETTFAGNLNQEKALYRNLVRSGEKELSFWMSLVKDCSIFTNAPQFFRVSEGQLKNDILCLNGIRCITMIWVIMAHTMMYNDWSAFGRTREVEKSIKSPLSQPLFNGSYLVDTFFLMSGLLSAFNAFKHSKGSREKFNSFAYIISRWLRLTPQIFFVSMMYIVIPALSYGPHWYPIVGEYSENCIENWWVNVLHLQAFMRQEKMCNFVTWWISIDFFYHLLALFLILILLITGHQVGFFIMSLIVMLQVSYQAFIHFQLSLPPNVLSTIPQSGAMWLIMIHKFFWTPYAHSVPFFSGFYIGYLIALKKKLVSRILNSRLALFGWALSISLLIAQSYGTYWWVIGEADYTRWFSTTFYVTCSFIWAWSLCWIILACHYGYGGFINRVLSWKVFIVLGKASYLVYLTHFQIMFLFFGNQSLLLEPVPIDMFYMIIGNIFLSTLLGIFLCIFYELPWLKAQRRLIKYV